MLVNPFTSQVVDKEILGALNWEFQSKGSFTKDLFPEVPGPRGKPKIFRPQMISSELLVADEVMSAYKPRTSPTGDLAHVSFVERKPKNLGNEFKRIHDGRRGLTLFLDTIR